MSLVIKNKQEYADGGFGCIIAIEEAIRRGATEVDAIISAQRFNWSIECGRITLLICCCPP